MCELLHLAEKSAAWELENTIIKSRPTPAHVHGTPKACKQVRSRASLCPWAQLWQICQYTLDEGTRRDGLLSTFLFHVFELLPCKSQFAKKHDKIMVGPAESAQLCCAKLIPAVNHVHSPNTKAGLHSSANSLFTFAKNDKMSVRLVFSLLSLYWTIFILELWINTEGINEHGEFDLPAICTKTEPGYAQEIIAHLLPYNCTWPAAYLIQ